ncbi:hypothetical protein MASR2M17_05220 [Aminivibrio sp.]
MRIYHNIPALYAYNSVSSTNSAIQKSIEKLSTGLRINSAADDAAGLAISEKMRGQVRGLDQAVRNSQDGISMIQTAEGALNETHSILQRMRELSVQAANDTLTSQDRGYIQLEVDQLKEEVSRISTTTQFNKKKLLDGSAAVLWSSDNLETKALVRGALRQIDQFGQKSAAEGNFKISIIADPGEAQIQKSDLFKIKHPNVIMNVTKNESAGVQDIRVDNLPAGTYNINQAAVAAATFDAVQQFGSTAVLTFATAVAGSTSVGGASIYLEVVSRNTATNQVTFRAVSNLLNSDGSVTTKVNDNLVVGTAGQGLGSLGLAAANTIGIGTVVIGTAGSAAGTDHAAKYAIGNKIVLHYAANTAAAGANAGVVIAGETNPEWFGHWGNSAATNLEDRTFNLLASAVRGNDVHFGNFYLSTTTETFRV